MKKQNKAKRPPKVRSFNLVVCIVFFAVLAVFAALTSFLPKKTFSETENIYLQSFPKFSSKALFDGSFTDKLETYIAHHFAGRTSWISLKTGFEYALGKREQNGIYILGGRLIEKVAEPDYSVVDKSIKGINKFASDNNVPVFVMLVPTSAEFYKTELPSYMPELDQREFINYVYAGLDEGVSSIDVYADMSANADKYIYYRTDHHWTSYGAYLAYRSAGKKMGYDPHEFDEYDIEHASSEFRGTFYSKAMLDTAKPDIMDYYRLSGGELPVKVEITNDYGVKPETYNSMYFRDYLSVKDKYASFLGTNTPMVKIKSGADGGKLLIIKDSYAHCYAPFLSQHYSEVTLIDMRYINMSYKNVINVSDYDQVLFLYNVSSFASDENIRRLSYG